MVDMTYVALRRVKIGGKFHEAGELLPELEDSRRLDPLISQNKIAKLPLALVDEKEYADAVKEYKDRRKSAERERVANEAPVEEPVAEAPEPEVEDEDDLDVEEFNAGSGWYEIPGHDKKVRRDEAVALLKE